MYTYTDLTCIYLMFIWTCIVMSVIIVACNLFLSVLLTSSVTSGSSAASSWQLGHHKVSSI